MALPVRPTHPENDTKVRAVPGQTRRQDQAHHSGPTPSSLAVHTILIAHRLTSVPDADQVAVVEDGRVVEHGPPERLRAAGGRFAELFDRWLVSVA
jgi:hypothetical protein